MLPTLRSKLLWKLYAGYVVLIVLTAAIIGALDSAQLAEDARSELRRRLEDGARVLSQLGRPALHDPALAPPLQARVAELGLDGSTRFTLIAADGTVLADSSVPPSQMENHAQRPEIREARGGAAAGFAERFSTTTHQSMVYIALPVRHGDDILGFARTAHPAADLTRRTAAMRGNVALAASLAALAACVLGFMFARSLTNRLRSMSAVAEAMVAGDYRRRAPPMGNDEVGKLARNLNAMASELSSRVETITKERKEVLAILKSMVEGVVAVDRMQRVVLINDEARRILRIGDEDVSGRPIWEVTRIQAVCDILDLVIRSANAERDEVSLAMRGGDRSIELHSTPLRDDREEVVGAVVVLHDITELRRLEEVRRDFVTNVSHELKTPLTAIRGFVETLLDEEDTKPDTRRRFLGKIRAHTHRLSTLVSDLLTLSRVESQGIHPAQTPIDLREPVRASTSLLGQRAEEKGLLLMTELADQAVRVIGDSEMLRQVADNLVDNAIKYTPSGGQVRVDVHSEGDVAILEVADNGVGLRPQDQQRIFERFYRVDRGRSRELGGTGLGLSIVKHVVLAHDGQITVASTPGTGSSFRVELPLASTASDHASDTSEETAA